VIFLSTCTSRWLKYDGIFNHGVKKYAVVFPYKLIAFSSGVFFYEKYSGKYFFRVKIGNSNIETRRLTLLNFAVGNFSLKKDYFLGKMPFQRRKSSPVCKLTNHNFFTLTAFYEFVFINLLAFVVFH